MIPSFLGKWVVWCLSTAAPKHSLSNYWVLALCQPLRLQLWKYSVIVLSELTAFAELPDAKGPIRIVRWAILGKVTYKDRGSWNSMMWREMQAFPFWSMLACGSGKRWEHFRRVSVFAVCQDLRGQVLRLHKVLNPVRNADLQTCPENLTQLVGIGPLDLPF